MKQHHIFKLLTTSKSSFYLSPINETPIHLQVFYTIVAYKRKEPWWLSTWSLTLVAEQIEWLTFPNADHYVKAIVCLFEYKFKYCKHEPTWWPLATFHSRSIIQCCDDKLNLASWESSSLVVRHGQLCTCCRFRLTPRSLPRIYLW